MLVLPLGIDLGNEYVEAAHARMAIGGKVEVAVGSERWEHLVTGRIDRLAEILHASQASLGDAYAPQVKPSLAAGHI